MSSDASFDCERIFLMDLLLKFSTNWVSKKLVDSSENFLSGYINKKKWASWCPLDFLQRQSRAYHGTLGFRQVIWPRYCLHVEQDGPLAPAYFSPNCKNFDQLFQTVKTKTTVLSLVFRQFLQTSIWPLISALYAKGYHDFPSKLFCLTVPKKFVEEPFCAVF